MEFKWEFCPICEAYFIRCPKCGNNCCNGASGQVDGQECDVCELCYEFQELSYNNHLQPKITDEDVAKALENKQKLDADNKKAMEYYYNNKLIK
jgi:ribosome-binding protein aMBF1 (putative translation factor)